MRVRSNNSIKIQIMTKKQNNPCGDHIQMCGAAYFDKWQKRRPGQEQPAEYQSIFFSPDNPVPGALPTLRRRAVVQLMQDGTFEVIAAKDGHAKSKLIKKLAHGRLSHTRDGAIQLTLKYALDERINIVEAIAEEAAEACCALIERSWCGGGETATRRTDTGTFGTLEPNSK